MNTYLASKTNGHRQMKTEQNVNLTVEDDLTCLDMQETFYCNFWKTFGFAVHVLLWHESRCYSRRHEFTLKQ